ncbi:hypothetical protein PoB_004615600 [Plakobranchus ocellatus]|uniref:Uncharacterized protein n=1 Tax=Plakobranchus ocellatus TaxID=259542 RepID=A0AAV4BKY6_9GAST|nr:hypothetical protein PoB_004615600 [Plakobranchus ocellatus]
MQYLQIEEKKKSLRHFSSTVVELADYLRDVKILLRGQRLRQALTSCTADHVYLYPRGLWLVTLLEPRSGFESDPFIGEGWGGND